MLHSFKWMFPNQPKFTLHYILNILSHLCPPDPILVSGNLAFICWVVRGTCSLSFILSTSFKGISLETLTQNPMCLSLTTWGSRSQWLWSPCVYYSGFHHRSPNLYVGRKDVGKGNQTVLTSLQAGLVVRILSVHSKPVQYKHDDQFWRLPFQIGTATTQTSKNSLSLELTSSLISLNLIRGLR